MKEYLKNGVNFRVLLKVCETGLDELFGGNERLFLRAQRRREEEEERDWKQ